MHQLPLAAAGPCPAYPSNWCFKKCLKGCRIHITLLLLFRVIPTMAFGHILWHIFCQTKTSGSLYRSKDKGYASHVHSTKPSTTFPMARPTAQREAGAGIRRLREAGACVFSRRPMKGRRDSPLAMGTNDNNGRATRVCCCEPSSCHFVILLTSSLITWQHRTLPTWHLSDICSAKHSNYLTYLLNMFWHRFRNAARHSVWHMFWRAIWHYFWHSSACDLTYILKIKYGIILLAMFWYTTWHIFWHIFWYILKGVWHSFWHTFWRSIWHIWHSIWHYIWHLV